MKRGFTLIEVLISLVIFSIIAVLAASAFRFLTHRLPEAVKAYPSEAVVFYRFQTMLDSIFFYTVREKEGPEGVESFHFYFVGFPREFSAITFSPIYSGRKLSIFKVFLKDGTLWLTEEPLYSAENDYRHPLLEEKTTFPLWKDVAEVNFTYITGKEEKKEIVDEIPQGIRMRLKFEGEDDEQVFYFHIKSDFLSKKHVTATALYPPI
ncbi:hypothetical protein DRN43_06095 [Thermococci archaeon]|nr:MAG: hypothetical protein DRN43_06095 [Thermococci archaeon]